VQKLLLRLWERRVRKRITKDDRPMKIFFFADGKSFFSIQEKISCILIAIGYIFTFTIRLK